MLVVAVQAALVVSLFGGPAVVAAAPPDPVPTDVAPHVTPEPATEPSVEPVAETPLATVEPVVPAAEPTVAPDVEPSPADEPSSNEPTAAAPAAPCRRPRRSSCPVMAPVYVGTIETVTTVVAVARPRSSPGEPVTAHCDRHPEPAVRQRPVHATTRVPSMSHSTPAAMAHETVLALPGTTSATAEFLGCGEYSSQHRHRRTSSHAARAPRTLVSSHETAVRYEDTVTLTGYVSGPVDPTGSVTFARLGATPRRAWERAALVRASRSLVTRRPSGRHLRRLAVSFAGRCLLKPAVSEPVTHHDHRRSGGRR